MTGARSHGYLANAVFGTERSGIVGRRSSARNDGLTHGTVLVGLGVWYGWGYCPCTDWHWRVRLRMGFDDPPSYIQLLIRVLTGIVVEPRIADALALVTLAVATLLSLMLRARARGQSNL